MEFVHQFFHHGYPILVEFLVPGEPLSQFPGIHFGENMLLVVVVQLRGSRIVTIIGNILIGTVVVAAFIGDPPAERSTQMLGQTKGHIVLISSSLPKSADIFARTHFHRVERVNLRIIVEEVVMVHSLGHKIPGACTIVQVHQLIGIEILCFPKSADILISKLGRMAIMAHMVQVLRRTLNIHIPSIPVTEHGHTLRTPMAPDAKLHITEPLRALICSQRIKICIKPLAHNCQHLFLKTDFKTL